MRRGIREDRSISGANLCSPEIKGEKSRETFGGKENGPLPRGATGECAPRAVRGECRGKGEGGVADTAAAGQGGRGVAGDTHRGIAREGARARARRHASGGDHGDDADEKSLGSCI